MAAVAETRTYGRAYIHIWNLTTADPTGDAVDLPGAADRTVQFVGSNWGAATAVFEGSLDGTTYFTLTDPQGNAISKTADAMEAAMEGVRYIRVRLSAVGVGAVVQAVVLSRSTMP